MSGFRAFRDAAAMRVSQQLDEQRREALKEAGVKSGEQLCSVFFEGNKSTLTPTEVRFDAPFISEPFLRTGLVITAFPPSGRVPVVQPAVSMWLVDKKSRYIGAEVVWLVGGGGGDPVSITAHMTFSGKVLRDVGDMQKSTTSRERGSRV